MRPRQFDNEEVLRIAFDQFWRNGVRGTSLTEIAQEAGILRGSLYNAFGSKEGLFLSAYRRYAEAYLATIAEALDQSTLRERLARFFDVAIENFRSGSPPRGCPTTRGLMELSSVAGEGLDEVARLAFADLISRVVALVESALREGATRGEFAGDVGRCALHLVTIARGLVVLERAYDDEDQLHAIARHAIDLVLAR